MSVERRPRNQRSTRRATSPETTAITERVAYQGALSAALQARIDVPHLDAADPRLVLQADFPSPGASLPATGSISELFKHEYSSGETFGVTRIALSQNYAAVEMHLERGWAAGKANLGIVFDFEKNTYLIGTAGKDEPLLRKTDKGKIRGMSFSQPHSIPLNVLKGLKELATVVNNREQSRVITEGSLIKEEETAA